MKSATSLHAQRGATLVMGLILLAVLMLTVTASFMMSNNNAKSVGNMQSRAEAVAAADAAVEKLISTDAIFLRPVETVLPVDAYGMAVTVAAPECLKSEELEVATSADPSSGFYIQGMLSLIGQSYAETYWDIRATVTNGATGAAVETHQGIKLIMPSDPDPCV